MIGINKARITRIRSNQKFNPIMWRMKRISNSLNEALVKHEIERAGKLPVYEE